MEKEQDLGIWVIKKQQQQQQNIIKYIWFYK